ncbi:MAG TPA: hypothetical protein VN192_02875 [Flavobacterium sp.]|nr:hypothetical protein [Flavobacterium sp.]
MEEIKQIIIDKVSNLEENGPFCIEFDVNEFAVIAKGSIYRQFDKWDELYSREVLFSEIYVTNDVMEKYFSNQEISDLQNQFKK